MAKKRILCAGGSQWRIISPYANLSNDDIEFTVVTTELKDQFSYDGIILHQPCTPILIELIHEFQKLKKVIVVDCDDDMSLIPASNPVFKEMKEEERMPTWKECIKICDYIHVTTPELKESLKQQKKTTVFPNGIDLPKYSFNKENSKKVFRKIYRIPEGNKIVSWTGSITHHQDLELIYATIRELQRMPNITLLLCSRIDWLKALGFRAEHFKNMITIDWLSPDNYRQTQSVVDVNLAPLVNNKFNQCKSELRLQEYGAFGIPSVASAVAPYNRFEKLSEDKNVYLVKKERVSLWMDAIESALGDKEVGLAAQETVKKYYDLKTINEERVKWWKKILQT